MFVTEEEVGGVEVLPDREFVSGRGVGADVEPQPSVCVCVGGGGFGGKKGKIHFTTNQSNS